MVLPRLCLIFIAALLLVPCRAAGGSDAVKRADALTAEIDHAIGMWHYLEAISLSTQQFELRFQELGPHHPDTVRSFVSLAKLSRLCGDRGYAKYLLERALKLCEEQEPSDPVAVASVLVELLRLQNLLRRTPEGFDIGRDYYERASHLLNQDDHPRLWAEMTHAWGNHLRAYRRPGAVDLYRSALRVRREALGRHLDIASNLTWLSHLLLTEGDQDQATLYAKGAIEELRALGIQNHRFKSSLLPLVGRSYQSSDPAKCLRFYEEASRQAVAARAHLPAGMPGRVFVGPSAGMATTLLRQGHTEQAWAQVVVYLGIPTREHLITHSGSATGVALKSLRRKRTSLLRQSKESGPELTLLDLERFLLENRIAQAERVEVQAHEPWTTSRIDEELSENTAFVFFGIQQPILQSDEYGAFVVRKGTRPSWTPLNLRDVPSFNRPFSNINRSISDAIEWPSLVAYDTQLDEWAHEGYDRIIRPILPHLKGIDRVVLLPYPYNGIVPLLQNADGERFGESFEVCYAPSPQVYLELAAQDVSVRSVLAIGDPRFGAKSEAQFDLVGVASTTRAHPGLIRDILDRTASVEDLPRLAESGREASGIADLFASSKLLVRRQATIPNVVESIAETSFDVLHFATHALAQTPWLPESAGLALTPTEDDGTHGLLEYAEFSNWELDSDLVTLSACQTGVYDSWVDGPLGYLQGFLGAGARSVLLTRWKVNDSATRLLMQEFYRQWLDPIDETRISKVRALQAAKRFLREYTDESGETPYAHPVYWAGFGIYGNPN